MTCMQQHSYRHQLGFTLVEAIVAVLLLGSCVIGIGAIYAQHDKTVRGGKLHAHAVELAKELAERMRVTPDPQASFETTIGTTCKPAAKPDKDTPSNIVACWQNRVETELTNGSTYITLDRNSVPPQYMIAVSWSEPRSGTATYLLRVPTTTATAVPRT